MNMDLIALERAKKALQRGFDAEAYIVMGIAENRLNDVPNSTVDENIKYMGTEFVNYMGIKENYNVGKTDEKTLLKYTHEFLNYISKILAEVRANASTPKEKEAINQFIYNLQNLLK